MKLSSFSTIQMRKHSCSFYHAIHKP